MEHPTWSYVCARPVGKSAHRQVQKAIREERLPKLGVGHISCTDCDTPAQEYDHRWYSKPLDVEPVCRGCNIRRGPAFDSPLRQGWLLRRFPRLGASSRE